MLEGRTFLITGATGRLGCDLTERLEQLHARVLPVVLPGYPPRPKRLSWKARTAPIVIKRVSELEKLPTLDYVIHLHWTENRTLSDVEQRQHAIDGSTGKIAFFWDWLRGRDFERLVNISSIKMFANNSERPITSRTVPRPATPYGFAKAFLEQFLDAAFGGRAITHLRLCSVASAGEHESQLLTRLYLSAFKGKEVVVNAAQTHLLYIDDAVDLMIEAARRGVEKAYNLMAPGHSNAWIAARFEEVSGRKLHAVYGKRSGDGVEAEFESDVPKLLAEWVRVTPIEQAIQQIIQHYETAVETTTEELSAIDRN